jgi:hypothetical protein
MVPIALRGGRVTSTFRDAVFDAATRRGMSVNEFVLTATAKMLMDNGKRFTGVFQPGDAATL